MPRKMAKQMTPAQYMKSHYVTRELQRLGVTDEQLQNMRFSGKNRNDPFERWSFWFDGPADGPSPLVKAYCALKWLILEGPPASREREDAWRLVGEAMAAPTFAIGDRARTAQRKRAKEPRGKVAGSKKTIGEMIRELAQKPQHRHETARELWTHFFDYLGGLELDPREVSSNDPSKSAYSYDFQEKRKRIGFERFSNIVSEAGQEKKSL